MECEQETVPKLSNSTIFNYFELPLTEIFFVTPLFDGECLRNRTIYRHSYNEILIGIHVLVNLG